MNNNNFNNEDFYQESENDNDMFSENDEIDDVEYRDLLDSDCPMSNLILSISMMDKPFGMLWKPELMIKLLKNRGYNIISRKSEITGEDYKVAFKDSDGYIPETEIDNIRDVFNLEVQKIILDWLLKISK